MSFSKRFHISTFAAALAVGFMGSITAASSGSPSDNQSSYLPIQSISHEFGSKWMSGYFTQQAATCVVMLMVTEKNGPDEMLPPSPMRVRVVLRPGQVAGLDSEEDGRSLNFTCGTGAATLRVDVGDTDKLAAIQVAQPTTVAASP
jgi:hypothetical protein